MLMYNAVTGTSLLFLSSFLYVHVHPNQQIFCSSLQMSDSRTAFAVTRHQTQFRCNSLHSYNTQIDGDNFDNRMDDGKDYSIIRKGGIYIEHNFLTPSDVSALRNDIAQLKDSLKFKPSGLSNRIEGDENDFGDEDRLTCTITPDLFRGDRSVSYIRDVVERKLDVLRRDFQSVLSPSHDQETHLGKDTSDPSHSVGDSSIGSEFELAEMYYSISPRGSYLPRHNDERHEDTKGERGWIHDTRRSISWLVYLNGYDWGASSTASLSNFTSGDGGELRAYCRNCSSGSVQCGSHEGDLQVGWLRMPMLGEVDMGKDWDEGKPIDEFEPVFLDSWVKTPVNKLEDEAVGNEGSFLKWFPLSALYRMKRIKSTDSSDCKHMSGPEKDFRTDSDRYEYYPHREYLSRPFGADSPSWPTETNLEPSDFANALVSQISDDHIRDRFIGTEAIDDSGINIIDVLPTGGTLVLFDSVAVPHEVLKVTSGERFAVAGWFHEQQQQYPDWFGT